MSEMWMNYAQLAEHWRMSQEAARTRARRGRFPRRVGNDGQAEVLIDSSAPLPRPRPPRSGGQTQTPATLPAPASESPPAATAMALEALAAHITTLESQLAAATATAAAERERVADLTAKLLDLTGQLLQAQAGPRKSWWWRRLAG